MKKRVLVFLFILICSSLSAEIKLTRNKPGAPFLDQNYILESQDYNFYKVWLEYDKALSNPDDNENILKCQNDFLTELEKQKNLKQSTVSNNIYELNKHLKDIENACFQRDAKQLSYSIAYFFLSRGLIYQKGGSIYVQLIILMGGLILLVMALLFFYQFTYARKIEIEKILKATNNGQEEERRRLALELHDSVAQQMRYVSILAEKIDDKELAKEIKDNQSMCIENIRNTCYTLSSINIDNGSFVGILKASIDSFQKRTGISTSLIITPDVDFKDFPQITFHHLFRIIIELLTNIEKHADASEVTVLIRNPMASDKMHEGLFIFISDDGKGLDSNLMEVMNSKKITGIKNMHFGLQNIKLRLNEINGSIRYFSEKGEGTEVEIRIGK